jgi:hypothetical protein
MLKGLLLLAITIVICLLSSCEDPNTVQLDELEYVYAPQDTITRDSLMKHVTNIIGIGTMKSFFGNPKIKDGDQKIKDHYKKNGYAAEERTYSFLSEDKEKRWIAPILLEEELLIDTVFFLVKYPEIEEVTPVLLTTCTDRTLIMTTNPILATFNAKGEKVDAILLSPKMNLVNASMTTYGDTLVSEITEFFIFLEDDLIKVGKGSRVKHSISATGKFSSPDKVYSKSTVMDTIIHSYAINKEGMILKVEE